MEIGEKIKFLRMRQGMTLEELGLKVGVGKSTVRKWETGQIANMRRDKIASLADALNVSPSYLMGWEDEINVDMDMKNNSSNTSDNIGNIDKLLYCEKTGVMNIGERIKNRRVELNLTQEELAKMTGYTTRSTINKIEQELMTCHYQRFRFSQTYLTYRPHILWGGKMRLMLIWI